MKDIFGPWLKNVMMIKEQCSKDNQLCKMLISSSWGCFSEVRKIRIDNDDHEALANIDLDEVYYKGFNPDYAKHEYVPYANPAKYAGFYRLKLFLTASVRTFMMNYAIKNDILPLIARIHTDSYMLTQPKEFCVKLNKNIIPKPEAKSTGYIKLYNSQRYYHVCKKCNNEYKYATGHEC
jgi:hypothetical protein